MVSVRWRVVCAVVAVAFIAALALLLRAVPSGDDGRDWTGQLIDGGWMAWTFPVALFFLVIAGVQMLTTGVLAELLMRVYYDVGQAKPYRVRQQEGEAPPPPDAGWHA